MVAAVAAGRPVELPRREPCVLPVEPLPGLGALGALGEPLLGRVLAYVPQDARLLLLSVLCRASNALLASPHMFEVLCVTHPLWTRWLSRAPGMMQCRVLYLDLSRSGYSKSGFYRFSAATAAAIFSHPWPRVEHLKLHGNGVTKQSWRALTKSSLPAKLRSFTHGNLSTVDVTTLSTALREMAHLTRLDVHHDEVVVAGALDAARGPGARNVLEHVRHMSIWGPADLNRLAMLFPELTELSAHCTDLDKFSNCGQIQPLTRVRQARFSFLCGTAKSAVAANNLLAALHHWLPACTDLWLQFATENVEVDRTSTVDLALLGPLLGRLDRFVVHLSFAADGAVAQGTVAPGTLARLRTYCGMRDAIHEVEPQGGGFYHAFQRIVTHVDGSVPFDVGGVPPGTVVKIAGIHAAFGGGLVPLWMARSRI